jgi:chemotaxis-related protein WspD
MESCWTVIGVRGDRSCPELPAHVHCRNCPVHAAAAVALLDAPPAADYLAEWSRHVAAPHEQVERGGTPLLVFRLASEWFALAAPVVEEVMRALPVHSVPHRRRDVVLGVTNVRGTLTPCVALATILAIDARPAAAGSRGWQQRCLILRDESLRIACPVDEVSGLHRVREAELQDVPATIARAASTYTTRAFALDGRPVGILDHHTLLAALRRSLA